MTSNISAKHERTFSEIKRLTTADLEGPELLARVADGLGKAISFSAYCASTTDPVTNLITCGIAEGMGEEDEEAGNVFMDRIYFEEGLPQIAAMMRERRSVELLSEATDGHLDRSLRYRELLKPNGFGYELGSAFIEGRHWGGMDLIRDAEDRDFNAREVSLVKRVAPHVGVGLKVAALRSRATRIHQTSGYDSSDLPGVLNLDRKGRILSYTPAARRWLQELEDLHPAWHQSVPPVPIRMVVGALRQSLAPTADREIDLVPRVRLRGRSGRWLTLYGSLTEPRGDLGEISVVIEPARAEEITWLNIAAYDLTPRESEVVKLVARGHSTRQMSESLYISEYTVQRHLQNAFEKVGVRSRRELMKRLFFEDFLPNLFSEQNPH